MTPWDFVMADPVPAGVKALPLLAAPYQPISWAEVQAATAPLSPGVVTWLAPPYVQAQGTMLIRNAAVEFQPFPSAGSVSVQGFAIVDLSGMPDVLAIVWVLEPAEVSESSGPVVFSGLVVVVRRQ